MRKLEKYVVKDGKKLRYGYTTGSCAAAASKAAVLLLNGELDRDYITISVPKGFEIEIDIESIELKSSENSAGKNDFAIVSVIKDAGDDPDVTNEIEIFAKASRRSDGEIHIKGGVGVGKITIEGFWGKVGDSAINPVPRKMIESEIRKVSDSGYDIEIFVPSGEEIAKRTFNQNIGIIGGISIIGTSGIVEPMSEDALKKCIYMEIDNIVNAGKSEIILYPGNYGEKMAAELFPNKIGVKISNYIGESLLYCQYKGIEKIKLVGHIGKFSKLSLGAFNTHSKVCDMRIEAFVYYLALRNDMETMRCIMDFKTSEEVVEYLKSISKEYIFEDMKNGCTERIKKYLKDEDYDIEVVLYSMKYGVI